MLGLQGWLMRGGASGKITLLRDQPFSAAMLPGESRWRHFGPGPQRDAVLQAVEEDFGMLASPLKTPAGNTPIVAPLLEVRSVSDDPELGTFVELSCVGRARLRNLHFAGDLTRAVVSPFRDGRIAGGLTGSGAAAAARRVKLLHGSCYALHQELSRLEVQLQPQPAEQPQQAVVERRRGAVRPEQPAYDGVVVPTRAAPAQRMARKPARFVSPLRVQVNKRRETLLSQPGAQYMWPKPTLDRLPLMSGAAEDHRGDAGYAGAGYHGATDAELVLLSFAAHASLGAFDRLRALDTSDTVERLRDAGNALRRQRDRLAATLALRRAALSPEEVFLALDLERDWPAAP
tara:strand:+ start:307 stop:1344 length:1038 start_codon:yes stop_codon:yes gene_type:complete